MDSKTKLIIVVAAFIIIGLIAYAIYASSKQKPKVVVTHGTSEGSGGLGQTLGSIVSGIFGTGWAGNIFGGGKGSSGSGAACDPNKPGYDVNGFPSVDCGFGG